MPHLKNHQQEKGFTLLEVMIALAIFVIAAVTIDYAIQGRMRHYEHNRDRVLATWLAQNYAVSVNAGVVSLSDTNVETLEYADRFWEVRTILTETERDNIKRLDIEVFHANADFKLDSPVGGLTQLVIQP